MEESVTKIFYDAGWHGINVEPLTECYRRLKKLRKRDINIQALVGSKNSFHILHEFPQDGRYSTVDRKIAERHQQTLGMKFTERMLPVTTLNSLCEKYACTEIQFLKIDVEGNEAEVLQGLDLSRIRPWILLIEATEPNSTKDSSQQWESLVTSQGYTFAYFDGLSKFYVAREKGEFVSLLGTPANIFDNYITSREAYFESIAKKTESLRWIVAKGLSLFCSKLLTALKKILIGSKKNSMNH